MQHKQQGDGTTSPVSSDLRCGWFRLRSVAVFVSVLTMGSFYPIVLKWTKKGQKDGYPFLIGVAIFFKNLLMLGFYSVRYWMVDYQIRRHSDDTRSVSAIPLSRVVLGGAVDGSSSIRSESSPAVSVSTDLHCRPQWIGNHAHHTDDPSPDGCDSVESSHASVNKKQERWDWMLRWFQFSLILAPNAVLVLINDILSLYTLNFVTVSTYAIFMQVSVMFIVAVRFTVLKKAVTLSQLISVAIAIVAIALFKFSEFEMRDSRNSGTHYVSEKPDAVPMDPSAERKSSLIGILLCTLRGLIKALDLVYVEWFMHHLSDSPTLMNNQSDSDPAQPDSVADPALPIESPMIKQSSSSGSDSESLILVGSPHPSQTYLKAEREQQNADDKGVRLQKNRSYFRKQVIVSVWFVLCSLIYALISDFDDLFIHGRALLSGFSLSTWFFIGYGVMMAVLVYSFIHELNALIMAFAQQFCVLGSVALDCLIFRSHVSIPMWLAAIVVVLSVLQYSVINVENQRMAKQLARQDPAQSSPFPALSKVRGFDKPRFVSTLRKKPGLDSLELTEVSPNNTEAEELLTEHVAL